MPKPEESCGQGGLLASFTLIKSWLFKIYPRTNLRQKRRPALARRLDYGLSTKRRSRRRTALQASAVASDVEEGIRSSRAAMRRNSFYPSILFGFQEK